MTALRHIGITVSDLDVSLRFYCQWLGLEVLQCFGLRSGEYISTLVGVADAEIDIVHLGLADGAKIELLQYRSHPRPAAAPAAGFETGRPHVAITVNDLDGLYRRRDDFCVIFKSPPLSSPDGVKVCYCHDPDGVILELVEMPP